MISGSRAIEAWMGIQPSGNVETTISQSCKKRQNRGIFSGDSLRMSASWMKVHKEYSGEGLHVFKATAAYLDAEAALGRHGSMQTERLQGRITVHRRQVMDLRPVFEQLEHGPGDIFAGTG